MTVFRLCILFLLFGAVYAQVFPASYSPIPADVRLERDLLTLTNLERSRVGLGALSPDDALALAARHHAREMMTLNYFSHSSPTPSNATLGQRVSQAGSAATNVGENLALVGPQDVAQTTVRGWMESPGHRENMLRPSFTHVGFGAAKDPNGRAFVAQVFAEKPIEVQRAAVTSRLQEVYRVEVELTLTQTKEVALFHGTTSLPTQVLGAGRHVLSLTADSPSQLHLRVGVRDPGTAGGFILHDDGWLGADGRWQPSRSAPRQLASIEGVSRRIQVERIFRADFTFTTPPERSLGVWLDGTYVVPDVQGRTLSVKIPGELETPLLNLGVQTQGERYTVLYSLKLDLRGAVPRLEPALLEADSSASLP